MLTRIATRYYNATVECDFKSKQPDLFEFGFAATRGLKTKDRHDNDPLGVSKKTAWVLYC